MQINVYALYKAADESKSLRGILKFLVSL